MYSLYLLIYSVSLLIDIVKNKYIKFNPFLILLKFGGIFDFEFKILLIQLDI